MTDARLQSDGEDLEEFASLEEIGEFAARQRQLAIDHASRVYGSAAAYDNAVMIGGYAAFFALWGGVSADITREARLVTAALIGISLILYIGWQILNMFVRQKSDQAIMSVFGIRDPIAFDAALRAKSEEAQIAQAGMLRLWPFIFVPSCVLGMAGGATLAWNALAAAFDWPQLDW